MGKCECLVCGYIYYPALGDLDNGIIFDSKFEDIPDEWICPDCCASKTQFKEIT